MKPKVKPDDNRVKGDCDNCGNDSDAYQYKWHWDTHSGEWIVICSKCYPNSFDNKEKK